MNSISSEEIKNSLKYCTLAYYDKLDIGIPTSDILDVFTGEDMSTIFIFIDGLTSNDIDYDAFKFLGLERQLEYHLFDKEDIPKDLFMDWYIDGESHFYIMTEKQICSLGQKFLETY